MTIKATTAPTTTTMAVAVIKPPPNTHAVKSDGDAEKPSDDTNETDRSNATNEMHCDCVRAREADTECGALLRLANSDWRRQSDSAVEEVAEKAAEDSNAWLTPSN
jgi:hypothetical protein